MKKLHKFLKVFIFVQLGGCTARVFQQYNDFARHPDLYATYSASWYTGVIITVALTAVTVTVTTVAYFVVGRIIKKRERTLPDDEPDE